MLTAIDQVANQNHLQMIKAMIPYTRPENQKNLSVCIKLLELQNIIHFYNQTDSSVSACSMETSGNDFQEILTDIRNFCEPAEQEIIDQLQQLLSTLELCNLFTQVNSNNINDEVSDE